MVLHHLIIMIIINFLSYIYNLQFGIQSNSVLFGQLMFSLVQFGPFSPFWSPLVYLLKHEKKQDWVESIVNFNYIINFDYHDNFLKIMRILNNKFEIYKF